MKRENRVPLIIILLAVAAGLGSVLLGDPLRRGQRDIAAEYQARLKRYRTVAPELLTYREMSSLPTGFVMPRAITLDQAGRVYVAGDSAVRIFSADGKKERDLLCDAPVKAVAVSAEGIVYAATRDQIFVFAASGKRLAAWQPLGASALISSLALLGEKLYVANAAKRQVVWYDREGKFGGVLGSGKGGKAGAVFRLPSPRLDLARMPDGRLAVNNPGHHRIEIYDATNTRAFSFGKASPAIGGFSGCCNPTHLAVLPNGNFVTSEKGIARVKIQDADGRVLAVVAAPKQFARNVVGLDLAVDAKGTIYVLDPISKTVRRFVKKKSP